METFINSIHRHTPLSEGDGKYFHSFFKKEKHNKNTLLLQEGRVAHEVYFILEGGMRQFFFDEKGNESTCNFAFEGDFITDLESFAHQKKCTTNIIVTEPTNCLVISCQDLAACMRAIPSINTFVRTLMEDISHQNIRRIQAMLSQSPEQQFENLLQHKPQILQRIPQRYIAQYLGIAPESLSRIRKRLLTGSKS